MTKYLAIAIGVLVIALGAAGWLLKESYEENGKLKQSNKQLTEAINAKVKATQSRANAERDVRQLAPADKLERLR